jgi:hypothetical protein
MELNYLTCTSLELDVILCTVTCRKAVLDKSRRVVTYPTHILGSLDGADVYQALRRWA